jgi:hypothetical protein
MLKPEVLEELLKLAGVPDNPQTREDLQGEFEDAGAELCLCRPIPGRVYRTVETAARRMQDALHEITRYNDLAWWDPELEKQLQAVEKRAQAERGRRGQPPKEDKQIAAGCALTFFLKHGSRKPSADPKNPFHEFAEAFYGAVTGKEIEVGGLDHHIRKALELNRNKNND